jgi:DNA-binding HxlR family transcriptional regulator
VCRYGQAAALGTASKSEAAIIGGNVSYALTDRGQALIPALEQISLWTREHLPADDS